MNITENLNNTEADMVFAELMSFETRDLCNVLSYFIMSLSKYSTYNQLILNLHLSHGRNAHRAPIGPD